MNTVATTLSFVGYIVAIGALGYYAYRETHDDAGFILANRELPAWLAALSAGASDMSGWLLLGLPGLAYVASGEATYLALGLFIGTYANWRFVAQPLRQQTLSYGDALTIPEFFERRFDHGGGLLRIGSALLILTFYFFYIGAGFVAGGKLFSTVFGIDYQLAVIVGALVVVSYTLWGGFRAVVLTDALQASLMLLALVVVAGVVGGSCCVAGPRAAEFAKWLTGVELKPIAVASALAWGLGYPGQPHIVVRFMALRNASDTPRARRIAVSWSAMCLIAAVTIGALASGASQFSVVIDDPERVFLVLVGQLFHPLIAGIFLAAILAAIMSTADSQLLVAAAAAFRDLKLGNLRRQRGNVKYGLGGLRATVAVVALGAAGMALEPENTVLGLVAYAWAGFGATLGPAIVLCLYYPKLTATGTLCGMLSGALTVGFWGAASGGVFELYALLPGFLINLGIATAVSMITGCKTPPNHKTAVPTR